VRAVAWAALLIGLPAHAERVPAHVACDMLVAPDSLSAHSQHGWREGPPIMLRGDVVVCNYYQEQAPAGLSLSVRVDPEKHDYQNARELYGRTAQAAAGLPGEAFYFRHPATAPFAPSWGLVLHVGQRTYRVEGVPEAENAEEARTLAREMMERALKRFSVPKS
jgi:hypothetical protein